MKRPLVPVALLFAAGVALASLVEVSLAPLFAAAFAAGLLALGWRRVRPLLLTAFLFYCGWVNLAWREARLSPHDLRELVGDRTELVTVRGAIGGVASQRVVERRETEFWHTLVPLEANALRIGNGSWQPAFGTVQTSTRGNDLTNFFAGQAVEVTGVLAPPPGAVAAGLFDYRAYLRWQGIYHQLRVDSAQSWQAVGPVLAPPWTEQFRRWAQTTLARGLPAMDEPLKLQWAMVLGWKTALTGEVSAPFMRSGTMHIFAISGLHIALISGILVALFRLVNLPRSLCGAAVIPLIWFYTAATEWQASAIRSTVMMTVVIAGWSLRRPSDLVNSLAGAAFIILLWDPAQLFQAGFQLSFGAVLSLAILMPVFERWRIGLLDPSPHELEVPPQPQSLLAAPRTNLRWLFGVPQLLRGSSGTIWLQEKLRRVLGVPDPLLPRELWPRWQRLLVGGENWLIQAASVSLAATVGTAPLIACYFHLFSPVSLVANLVVVPVSGLALMAGLGGVICGGWLPWAAEYFNHAGWFFMAGMAGISEWMARRPAAYCYVPSPGWSFLAFYYGLLAACLAGGFRSPRRRWVVACLAVLFCAWLGGACLERRSPQLTIFPLRGGDAAWLSHAGRAGDWLIDCGDAQAVEHVTLPFLQGQGVNRLPHLILTHGDVRQVGGGTNLLAECPVQALYASPLRFLSRPYVNVLAAWTNHHGPVVPLRAGDKCGPWTVLHPGPNDRSTRADDKALVLRGDILGTRVLLCSDLGLAGQSALLQHQPDLRAEIVVAGLPAGAEPLHDALLEAIRPRLIVITDDTQPAAARARPGLELRLGRRGVPVLFTRETRAVTIRFHRAGATVRTMSGLELQLENGPRAGDRSSPQ
jgi:competence protein ComEC